MSKRQRRAQLERRRRAAVSGRTIAAAGGLAVVATLLSGSVAEADTFQVANLNPTGTGSLNQAILDANAYGLANGDTSSTITFQSGLSGSINLTGGLPDITEPLYINGPGANVLTVHGTGSDGIFYTSNPSVTSVSISGLTLTGGNYQYGGAIDADSHLTLSQDVLTGNVGGYGGAIYATQGLYLYGTTVSGNTSYHGGGGIDSYSGTLSVKYSTIANNTATDGGGGIYQNNGPLFVDDSTISGNQSTRTSGGGAVGGGFYMGPGTVYSRLKDTIVSGNTAPGGGSDIYTSTSAATPAAYFSLLGSVSGLGITTDSTDLIGVNPLLGPLQANGGPTPTMAPAFNSPVIDQGNAYGFTSDQRGETRPVDLPGYPNPTGGDGSDIGAVELQPVEVLPLVSGLSVSSGVPGSLVVVVGAHLSTATTVQFGATSASFAVAGPGTLLVTVPQGSGTADVRVTTPGGVSPVVAGDKFTFTVPVTPPTTTTTTATFGNQAITLTTPLACTASTSKLSATLTSAAIKGSHGTKVKFSSAGLFLDRGIKRTHKKTEHLKNGKTKKVTVTTYSPNVTVHKVPATVSLKLKGLKSGSHTLKVVLSYKKTITVTTHHHKRHKTVTVTKTIRTTFKVC